MPLTSTRLPVGGSSVPSGRGNGPVWVPTKVHSSANESPCSTKLLTVWTASGTATKSWASRARIASRPSKMPSGMIWTASSAYSSTTVSRSPALYRSTYRSSRFALKLIVFSSLFMSRTPERVRAGSHLLGHVTREHEAHELVADIGGGPKHQGTAAIDHGDAVPAAVVGGRRRDAAWAGTAMHPDVLDAEFGALVHGVLGEFGPGADDHRLDPAGDGLQVLVAGVALDGVGVGVDRKDLIAVIAQPLVDDVAAVRLGGAGDPGDRHSLVGQELGCGLLDARHGSSLRRAFRLPGRHRRRARSDRYSSTPIQPRKGRWSRSGRDFWP